MRRRFTAYFLPNGGGQTWVAGGSFVSLLGSLERAVSAGPVVLGARRALVTGALGQTNSLCPQVLLLKS